MTISEKAYSVETREDFQVFLRVLAEDFRVHGEKWENAHLGRYLEALAAWAEDMDGYFRNRGETAPSPSWRLFAQMLVAARVYE